MLQQTALIATIAAGFIIGYILPRFTQEEMLPGRKYFKALETFLVVGIFFAALLLNPFTTILTVVLCALCFLLGFPRRMLVVYTFLFILTLYQPDSTVASIGFLYGLPAGTLYKTNAG